MIYMQISVCAIAISDYILPSSSSSVWKLIAGEKFNSMKLRLVRDEHSIGSDAVSKLRSAYLCAAREE